MAKLLDSAIPEIPARVTITQVRRHFIALWLVVKSICTSWLILKWNTASCRCVEAKCGKRSQWPLYIGKPTLVIEASQQLNDIVLLAWLPRMPYPSGHHSWDDHFLCGP
jgi:hypothetical protein